MPDSVVELQHVSQNLAIAYNAWQGSSFCKQFAVKADLAGLSDQQRVARQALLRMLGQLIDTEFGEKMDALCSAWQSYRRSLTAGGG